MQRSMFWDITLYNLPWRYQLSEMISNGDLPLWNAWMNNGFPQMGHYETWYPISWLISATCGYNLTVLQAEYLFNLYVAGLGFYLFSSLLGNFNQNIRIGAAAGYMLCGVFISQATHLGFITAGAWMPFVFYFFIRFCQAPKLNLGLAFVAFYFLLVTGGYAGNYIVCTYVLIGIFIWQVYKKENHKLRLNLLLNSAYLIPVFTALYAVVFYTTTEVQEFITRQELAYTNTGFGAQTGTLIPQSYFTFLAPSANVFKGNPFWGEIPMLNDVYIGLLPLLFLIYYFIFGRADKSFNKVLFLTGLSLLFFTITLSTFLPVHKILYNYFPLLDRFRFPSLYRIFGLFTLLLASIPAFQFAFDERLKKRFLLYLMSWILMGVFIAIPFIKTNLQFKIITQPLDEVIKMINQNGFIILDILIGLILLVLLIGFRKHNYFFQILLVLVGFDLAIHTWIRTPRYISQKEPTSITDNQMNAIPDGYPQNIPNNSVENWKKEVPVVDLSWHNRFMYAKYPMFEGSSPYALESEQKILQKGIGDIMKKKPFILVYNGEISSVLDTQNLNNELTQEILLQNLGPQQINFSGNFWAGQTIVFNHNSYWRWGFYSRGSKLESHLLNGHYLAVTLQESTQNLSLRFYSRDVKNLWILSLFTQLILTFYFISIWVKKVLNKEGFPK